LGFCDVEILGFDVIAIDLNYATVSNNTIHLDTVSNELETIQAEFILLVNHGIGYAQLSTSRFSPCASCFHDVDPWPRDLDYTSGYLTRLISGKIPPALFGCSVSNGP
jgi:hypothetical protein